jgi:hypothetical protein
VKKETGLNKVVVYSKEGCHLCERVIEELQKLRNDRLFEFSVKDITTDPELFERYRNMIPVLTIDDNVRLAGETLANPNTIGDVLRKAIFPAEIDSKRKSNGGSGL